MIINTLDELKKAVDPDLSIISSKYFGVGSRILRKIAPIYIADKDLIVDIKYKMDAVDGDYITRPLFAKSGFSQLVKDRVNIYLEERTHEVKMDSQQLGENPGEEESMAISSCTYPVIESLIKEMDTLLSSDANYVSSREVDVDATGTPANSWTAPTTCTPLTNIRDGFEKFFTSAKVMEDDPKITLLISPYLARLVINSDEYKTEVGTRKIIEPTFTDQKLSAVLGRPVILADGFNYGENGGAMYDPESTCYIIYVDNPMGNYSDIQRFSTNNSTFLVGCRNLGLDIPPANVRIGDDELFRLSGNIIASWHYTGDDMVTSHTMKSLMRSTVWIHNLNKLVRLKDIV